MSSKTSALVMGVGPEEGLGGSLCKRFAKEGMTVFVCGRTHKKVENLCSIINDTFGNAIPIVADVTDMDDVINGDSYSISLINVSGSDLSLIHI